MNRKLVDARGDKVKRRFVGNDSISGGNLQFCKVDANKKVSSNHGSLSCHSTEGDSIRFRLGDDLRETSGTPIKKLLAEQMSSKMETRRRPQSIIARLMGLDPLPPQQPNNKQHKQLSDSYLRRKSSVNVLENQLSYEGRSCRMSNKEQDFKDVFEVETSKTERHVCSAVQCEPTNFNLSEAKMAYIREKFMDVKRLSTDEKLQHSKEFHDALDVLDSNKDMLLKFLQEPDSLFTKHVYDLKGFPPPPQAGHITLLKSSNGQNYADKGVCSKPEGSKDGKSLHHNENGSFGHSLKKHGAHVSTKVAKAEPYERDDTCLRQVPKPHPNERDDTRLLPTRIVVLKPNIRKACNSSTLVLPPCSSVELNSSYRKQVHENFENLELFAEVRERNESSIHLELMKHKERGSREIAKEITRQMRRTVNYDFIQLTNSRLKGYAGDESSCSMSVDEFENDNEMITPSRHFFDSKSRHTPSSSYSSESSVSREAKKRLSERWNLTHRSQESRTFGRGNTLAEMLAMSDRESVSMSSVSLVGHDSFGVTPLGISSKDGWKDECSKCLLRSRSLPSSSNVFGCGSPMACMRHESLGTNKHSTRSEAVIHGSNKLRNGVFYKREGLLLKSNTKASHKKSYSVSYPGELDNHSIKENPLKIDERVACLGEKNLPEQKLMGLEAVGDLEESMWLANEIEVSGVKDVEMSLETNESQLRVKATCVALLEDGDFHVNDRDGLNPEAKSSSSLGEIPLPSCTDSTEAESLASSKEIEQASPLSVLEPLFTEDISCSSDSFERVSADLHELRMQLQLLKLESADTYECPEGHDLIVSSDDNVEGLVGILIEEEIFSVLQNEEKSYFSYVIDAWRELGFLNVDEDDIMKMWYSPESPPVNLSIWEKLENFFGEDVNWLKSDRRLLFDQINLGLMHILQHQMDPHPWVKKENAALRWSQEPLEVSVWNFLERERKGVMKDLFEVASRNEAKWLDLGDDADAVGREVERMVFNELVDEVLIL
ncbi:hypothetical protein Syun_001307 [Stephania yunnanensis]|uniref:DUF4378 domain-containing protein n=1 Tax=Stephania yunnanensis TaxID=152371 RepID=A0AAP0LDH2_9MAGN